MGRSPFISVVMPVYNCAKYLQEAIESILNQTFQDFEFIIVNDGSTDESPKILNYYAEKDSRIKIINQPNSGIVVALNRGLYEAKGEWVFRMDGDDIALPHRIEVQTKTVRGNVSLVLVGGWCQQINPQGIPLKINKYPTKNAELINALETSKPFFPHSSTCFRRDPVIELGGYRERFRHAEDHDLWLRLSLVGKFSCCQNVVLQLRKHPENISNLNSGHIQQLRAIAAAICHFRRKAGLSDPSQMGEEPWQEFLTWVEKRMDEEAYFQRMQGWQSLRNVWYANPEVNKVGKAKALLRELLQNPLARKALWRRYKGENFGLKLTEESKSLEYL